MSGLPVIADFVGKPSLFAHHHKAVGATHGGGQGRAPWACKPRKTSASAPASQSGYHTKMRKWPIWILLVLLPLRLWAGALMPVNLPVNLSVNLPVPLQSAAVGVACHSHTPANKPPLKTTHLEAHAASPHLGHSPHATPEQKSAHAQHGPIASTDTDAPSCEEGPGCMACSVCHLGAGLPVSDLRWSGTALHVLATTPLAAQLGHAWPPLIKPPIS